MPPRDALRERRIELGLSRKQMASQLGITTESYALFERGKRTPRLTMAFEIARILRASVPAVFPEVSAERTGPANG